MKIRGFHNKNLYIKSFTGDSITMTLNINDCYSFTDLEQGRKDLEFINEFYDRSLINGTDSIPRYFRIFLLKNDKKDNSKMSDKELFEIWLGNIDNNIAKLYDLFCKIEPAFPNYFTFSLNIKNAYEAYSGGHAYAGFQILNCPFIDWFFNGKKVSASEFKEYFENRNSNSNEK